MKVLKFLPHLLIILGLISIICSSHLHAQENSPQILIYKNGQLVQSTSGASVIDLAFKDLEKEFGIHLRKDIVQGFIFDADNKQQPGYVTPNIFLFLNHPLLKKSFESSYARKPNEQKEYDSYLAYAKEHASTPLSTPSEFDIPAGAYAFMPLDHVYMPAYVFGKAVNYDVKSGKSIDAAVETMLHESIHLWHSNNQDKVNKVLRSKGGYYEKMDQIEKVCPGFYEKIIKPHAIYDKTPYCAYPTHRDALYGMMEKFKWPQRYGKRVGREQLEKANSKYRCLNETLQINAQAYCRTKNEWVDLGDTHAFDDPAEYVAILMQLYVTDPPSFEKLANDEEKLLAQSLFKELQEKREATDLLAFKQTLSDTMNVNQAINRSLSKRSCP